jgi:hypothetical protein
MRRLETNQIAARLRARVRPDIASRRSSSSPRFAVLVDRRCEGNSPSSQPGQVDGVELQALGGVQRHDGDRLLLLAAGASMTSETCSRKPPRDRIPPCC